MIVSSLILVCPRFKDLAVSSTLSLWPAGGQAASRSWGFRPTGDETPLAHGQVIKFEEILIKN